MPATEHPLVGATVIDTKLNGRKARGTIQSVDTESWTIDVMFITGYVVRLRSADIAAGRYVVEVTA